MPNPTIVNSDTSELEMFNGVFRDRTVTVPAATTLAKYTVLGFDTTAGDTIGMESDNADGADVPRFILMEELVNLTAGAVDSANVQVMVEGEIDQDLLVFVNGTDTVDTAIVSGVLVKDAMKTEGLIATSRMTLDELDNQ